MAELPGSTPTISTTRPTLPGEGVIPTPAPLPSFWNDPQEVLRRVLAVAGVDPKAASEIWNEYRRLTK